LEVEPKFADAYVARGAAYVAMRRLDEAVADFRHAIKLDPQAPNAHQYLEKALSKV